MNVEKAISMTGVLAVIIIVCGTANALAQTSSDDKMLTVELKCPAEHKGVFVYRVRNKKGEGQGIRMLYENNVAVEGEAELKPAGFPFMKLGKVNIRNPEPGTEEAAQGLVSIADKWFGICLASKSKQQEFAAKLKANRKKLGLP